MTKTIVKKRLPAERCCICGKTLEVVGGKRIVAQKLRGIGLSEKYTGGGNPDYPHKSLHLNKEKTLFLVVWGEKKKWTEKVLENAKKDYLNNKQPWFCQVCGERKCSKCGSPINIPVGSDVIYESGCISHVPMIPADLGCINAKCEKYKDLSEFHKARNQK